MTGHGKSFIICLIFFLLLQYFFVSVFAEDEQPICERLVGRCVPCEKYHRSFSVRFDNLYADRAEYLPGETVHVSFDIVGAIEHPMAEGKIKVQVLTYYTGIRTFGEDVVDEFFLPDEISFKKYSRQHVEFTWKIPQGLPAGKYKIAFYYYMSSYSLGGHSDVTGLYSTGVTFNIKEQPDRRPSFIYFDRTKVFISDVHYNPTVFLPEHEHGKSLTVTIPLVNVGGAKKVEVQKRIYLWDDVKYPRLLALKEKGMIPETSPIIAEIEAVKTLQQTETIEVPGDSTKEIKYVLGVLPPEAYMVIITAKNLETGQKTVMPMRIPVLGVKARIAFASIADFPLEKDEGTTIGACFSISTTLGEALHGSVLIADGNKELAEAYANESHFISTIGSIEFEFLDESGKRLAYETVKPIKIVSDMRAVEIPFKAKTPLSRAKLVIRLWDSNGRLQDIEETFYDYAKFADAKMNLDLNAALLAADRVKASIELKDDLGARCKTDKSANIVVLNKSSGAPITTAQTLLKNCFSEIEFALPLTAESYIVRAFLEEDNSISAEKELKGIDVAQTPVQSPRVTPTPIVKNEADMGLIIAASAISFVLTFAALFVIVRKLRKKKRLLGVFVGIAAALCVLSVFAQPAKAAEIDGFQLFCPKTVPGLACWESYVKSYLRISWEPAFKTSEGKVLSGNVLYCEGEAGEISFDMNTSVSGDFMVAGGYTSCPPIAWKPASIYDDVVSWSPWNNVPCNDPRVQPMIPMIGKSISLGYGCQVEGPPGPHTLEGITCENCIYSPQNRVNLLGQPLLYMCEYCIVPEGQPSPAGKTPNVPCHSISITQPGAGLTTWNIFCKGTVKIFENNAVKQTFDITSAPPKISFTIPEGETQYKIKATLDVDCFGHSGYFAGTCWNRPHPVKNNAYSHSGLGPVGLPPYNNLLPATLSGEVNLNVVDPNSLFDAQKVEIASIVYNRQQTADGLSEKVITKFTVTNRDNYAIKIKDIVLINPTGKSIKIVQGKNVVLQPNKSTDVIIDSPVFQEKPTIALQYEYYGVTISCKKNEGTKTILLESFPYGFYAITSVTASSTKVGENIKVEVQCTKDLNTKLTLWKTDASGGKASPPIMQNISCECNKGIKEIGPMDEPGIYYVEAVLDIPGYYTCASTSCRKGTYVNVYDVEKPSPVPDLEPVAILFIVGIVILLSKGNTNRNDR